MKSKIEEIFDKIYDGHEFKKIIEVDKEYYYSWYSYNSMLVAIEKAYNQALEDAAENAKLKDKK